MTPLEAGLALVRERAQQADADPLACAKVMALLCGYDRRWSGADFEPQLVEHQVHAPLVNPDTGRDSRTFILAGKVDILGCNATASETILMDHKTCSEDIEDPAAPYWQQLKIEAQPAHYMLILWQQGRKVDRAIWDVVRKPDIKPKALPKAETAKAATLRRYFDMRLTDDDVTALNESGGRETYDMYAARLLHDCSVERPARYFGRRSVPRLDADLLDHARECWQHSQDIIESRRRVATLKVLPTRTPNACQDVRRGMCEYMSLCAREDELESPNWKRRASKHPELPVLPADERDLLTNSRVGTWLRCKRKHHYQYEMGIEPAHWQESEALHFGNLWHSALEAYFNQIIINRKAQHDGCTITPNQLIGIDTSAQVHAG